MSERDGEPQPPLVEELVGRIDAEEAFLRLSHLPHGLFLDSALRDPQLGRYSFVAADPFGFVRLPVAGNDALEVLAQTIAQHRAPTLPDLPPFQGGAAGLLSYDLGRQLERLPIPRFDEFESPAMAVGLYNVVLAFDHLLDRAWLISHGFPETNESKRRQRAEQRLRYFRELLQSSPQGENRKATAQLSPDRLAPQFRVGSDESLTSNFSRDDYLAAVGQAIEYIYAGDIFQVNLAQRLLHPATCGSIELYRRLRRCNPAPFAGYFDVGDRQIVSASPERFVRVVDREVEARPIKGTRRRSHRPEADLFAGDDLRASEKDRAENVMIVNLLRNDLSRVCQSDSVSVTQLCGLEIYQYVQHLVSTVRGELLPGRTAADLLRAAFPGGSITGAPKVRAMKIIAELEPTARGPYCGSLMYLGFNGTLDASILIRTITAAQNWWQAPVGGGIVAQSNPAAEYEETWHKAEGLLQAMRGS